MSIDIHKPELEQMLEEEILSGDFNSVEDLLIQAINALRQKKAAPPSPVRPRKNLADFLLESPFAASDLNLERQQDYGRSVDL